MKRKHIICSAAAMAAALIISFSAVTVRNRVLADKISDPAVVKIDCRDASTESMHVYYEIGGKTYGNKSGWKSKGLMTSAAANKRISGIKIKLSGKEFAGSIKYRVHIQGSKKWNGWATDGKLSGSQNSSKRVEAIRITLSGDVAKHYDVCYRSRCASYGWLDWAKNGETSGTVGYSKNLEAIQIVLVAKGSGVPGDLAGIVSKQDKAAVVKEAASEPAAEYKAEVGPSYPLKYENNAVYCYDPSTGAKKTGWIRINGMTYYFDPAKSGQMTDFNVNDFFSKAVFIGNSTSEGLTTYFNSKGKGYLGGPYVAAKVSYTFNSDKSKLNGYMLKYNGTQMQAKQLVKKVGAKYALIMMGTNDLMGTSAASVAKKYKSYIEGIQKENPGVVIYIQSTTPRRGTKNVKSLSNAKIDELNGLMKKYADSKGNVFYIDISTPLKETDGNMKKAYCSDGYVHLNMKGYKTWVNTVVDSIRKQYLNNATADAKKSTEAAGSQTATTETA